MRDPLIRDDELAKAIASLETPRARAAFRSGLRSALLATAASEKRDEPVALPRRRLAFAFAPRYVLAAAVILAVALGSAGSAAASSLPGEVLFPVKLAFEQVELALASDEPARVVVLSRHATRRLGELELVAAQRPDLAPTATEAYQDSVEAFRAAVDALKGAPNDARHDLALEVADRATRRHLEVLESVRERGDGPAVEEAIEKTKELKDKVEKDKEEQDRRREEGGRGRQSSPRR